MLLCITCEPAKAAISESSSCSIVEMGGTVRGRAGVFCQKMMCGLGVRPVVLPILQVRGISASPGARDSKPPLGQNSFRVTLTTQNTVCLILLCVKLLYLLQVERIAVHRIRMI